MFFFRQLLLSVFVAVGAHLSCTSDVLAQSIWERRSDEHAYLFYDTRARYVGDLVTVLIVQETDLGSQENRRMNKETESSGFFGFNFKTGGALGTRVASAAADIQSASERDFDGRSDYRSAQDLTDRITATVCEVLPNGNMVLRGQRDTTIAGESRVMTMSGVIRPIDLGPDNTIHSRYVADFQLVYEGVGPSQAFTRQGWLARKVNHIWPF